MLAAARSAVQSEGIERTGRMNWLKQLAKAAVGWAAANPRKAVELAIALAILGATVVTTKRLDRRALKRVARVFL